MKPIIIFIPDTNEIILSKKDLELYIENAYEQGFEDGKRMPNYFYTTNGPTIPLSNPSPSVSPWTVSGAAQL